MNGIHHVTAIAGSPQENIDFYAGVLGLRLVKRTVNFDDPLTYHLYYGTEIGAPGTILTFFAWPNSFPGRPGNGQVNATALAVPVGSLGWWQERFNGNLVSHDRPLRRFGEEVLPFRDKDGLPLELIAVDDDRPAWKGGGIPEQYAIRGVHCVTANEEGYERTAVLLTETMRFLAVGQEGNRFRYRAAEGRGMIDILCTPDGPRAGGGAGSVHHIAWRVPDDADQLAWRKTLVHAGMNVSPVLDRQYFHSIYYREPGGVLFEAATDQPGFAVDEAPESLGRALKLPPWLEQAREQIAGGLEPIKLP
ncbi:MAG TPA: ring-cleaving dioxygenase [Chthoniobacteraceae bacterium]|jgi:glyoxalase family protein|nr:ring-cleaving dioxygenase [Chthoniobacteraceae bacterium]